MSKRSVTYGDAPLSPTAGDAPLSPTAPSPRLPTEEVHGFARQRLDPILAREQPRAQFIPLLILPEEGEQARGEHYAAILLPFPLVDAEYHAGTIDIGDLKGAECRGPQAGRVEDGEHRPGFETALGLEEGSDFCLTQDRRGGFGRLGCGM
jgi:hypothetical protein